MRTGSSHSGLGEWLLQRISAVYVGAYLVFQFFYFSAFPPADFTSWHAYWSGMVPRMAAGLCILSIAVHAWIGMRSVFMDYLRPMWLKFVATSALSAALVIWVAWLWLIVGDVAR